MQTIGTDVVVLIDGIVFVIVFVIVIIVFNVIFNIIFLFFQLLLLYF